MIGFNCNHLLAVALFLLAVVTSFLLILVRKQSFAYLPAGEVRRGIVFVLFGFVWSSISLWTRGRWVDWPWDVKDVGQPRRALWYERFDASGHMVFYLLGIGMIILGLIR